MHYKTLNGGPYCHEMFFVGLQPAAADQPAAQVGCIAYECNAFSAALPTMHSGLAVFGVKTALVYIH